MSRVKNIVGQKFGRLTVLERAQNNRYGVTTWRVKCLCGNEKIVSRNSLVNGYSKSCGCLQREMTANLKKRHNGHGTRLYKTWKNMLSRCYCISASWYENYGGRGIAVCAEWRKDFVAFREWALVNGYDDTLSIDRIDSNGNYEPSNCRWVNRIVQNNNTRRNHYITINGETLTLAEWSRKTNIPRNVVSARINKLGWSPERALGKIETMEELRKEMVA